MWHKAGGRAAQAQQQKQQQRRHQKKGYEEDEEVDAHDISAHGAGDEAELQQQAQQEAAAAAVLGSIMFSGGSFSAEPPLPPPKRIQMVLPQAPESAPAPAPQLAYIQQATPQPQQPQQASPSMMLPMVGQVTGSLQTPQMIQLGGPGYQLQLPWGTIQQQQAPQQVPTISIFSPAIESPLQQFLCSTCGLPRDKQGPLLAFLQARPARAAHGVPCCCSEEASTRARRPRTWCLSRTSRTWPMLLATSCSPRPRYETGSAHAGGRESQYAESSTSDASSC